jgi:hypothetical protein
MKLSTTVRPERGTELDEGPASKGPSQRALRQAQGGGFDKLSPNGLLCDRTQIGIDTQLLTTMNFAQLLAPRLARTAAGAASAVLCLSASLCCGGADPLTGHFSVSGAQEATGTAFVACIDGAVLGPASSDGQFVSQALAQRYGLAPGYRVSAGAARCGEVHRIVDVLWDTATFNAQVLPSLTVASPPSLPAPPPAPAAIDGDTASGCGA